MGIYCLRGSREAIRPPAAVLLGLLLVAAACGDDSDVSTGSPNEATDTLTDEARSALFDSDDFDGWQAHQDVPWQPPLESCSEPPEGTGALDEAAGTASVELSRDDGPHEDLRGLFQDVVTFSDEAAADTYVASYVDAFERCMLEAEPPDMTVADVAPLDPGSTDLGADAHGWRVTFDPHPAEDAVAGLENLILRRGNAVAVLVMFEPLASELDIFEVASLANDRLPG